jgi:protein dithiol:quinone oxidoreductase
MTMKIISLRFSYFLAFLVCVSLYGYSIYLQVEAGLQPCPLCVLQRFVMILLAFSFFISFLLRVRTRRVQFIEGSFAAFFSLLGIVFAGRQVWLQQVGYISNESCAASLQYMLKVLPFEEALKNIFQGSAECSQIGWQFLSLSLSEWSLISFSVFLLFSLWQMVRKN